MPFLWARKEKALVPPAERADKNERDQRSLLLKEKPSPRSGQTNIERDRRSFIDWMTSRVPYVRVFTDRSTNMVAYIRLPPYKTDVVGGVIREKLSGGKKKDRITTRSFTARLRSYKTYQMTVLQRLASDKGFVDPWER